MKFILKLLITAVIVVVLSKVLPGASVDNYVTALAVAVVLGLLNFIVKPILVFFTLPVTIVTFGLFLLVINGIIVILCDKFIGGFSVNGLLWAIIFSLLLSFGQSILFSFLKEEKK